MPTRVSSRGAARRRGAIQRQAHSACNSSSVPLSRRFDAATGPAVPCTDDRTLLKMAALMQASASLASHAIAGKRQARSGSSARLSSARAGGVGALRSRKQVPTRAVRCQALHGTSPSRRRHIAFDRRPLLRGPAQPETKGLGHVGFTVGGRSQILGAPPPRRATAVRHRWCDAHGGVCVWRCRHGGAVVTAPASPTHSRIDA